MAKPASEDLRRRVVNAYKRGEGSMRELADRFDVGLGSVFDWVHLEQEQGHLAPKAHSGGNPTQKLFGVHLEALQRYLKEQPDLTNPKLVERLVADFGPQVRVHPSHISRLLKAAGITRKKKVLFDPKIDEPEMMAERANWKRTLRRLAFSSLCSLVFMDESYVRTHMTPTHGRAPRGQRVSFRIKHRARRYTLIGAMGLDGMKAQWLIGRGMSENDMVTYVTDHLIPALGPGRIVIWDNLKAHKLPRVLELMKAAGIDVYFQARYSPDLNPIEKAWSKIKTLVRSRQPRGAKDLRAAVNWAWNQIMPEDIRGYFTHCGLLLEQNSPNAVAVQALAIAGG